MRVPGVVSILALLSGSGLAAPLAVSASNTLVADWLRAVGGERVSVTALIPANADPHEFQPSTRDIARLSSSRVLFVSGAGLERWLPKLRGAASTVPITDLSTAPGVVLRQISEPGGATDPHTWWNPQNTAQFVGLIATTLTRLDPAGKASYSKNLAAYRAQLNTLDAYAKTQFAALPAERRIMVTNHDSQGYLAARYGLKIVGNVIPGLNSEHEPSARELGQLTDRIRRSGARVIFTENTLSARLAGAVSRETSVTIAPPLYTDALGPKGSAGESYLKMFRSNVDTIVAALK
jgi:ABC-type Zn uptake system ZnuABC Zn-binding protein ZnuA